MAHDVFISYSSKDKPVADAACATLESSGVRCWIAPRDVAPGVAYAESLAAVSYINETYGMSDIQRLLQRLSQGNSLESALRATIHSDYGQLESDVARFLADRYGE